MARRSDHSRAELSELAIAAAREIVAAEGLESLTARKIAQAIGYSPGTLYNVFEDLDDLIVQLNGRTLDALYDRLSAVPRTDDPARDLHGLLSAYLGFLNEHRNLWTVLFEYRLPNEHILPDWYLAKVERALGLIEAVLASLAPDLDPATRAKAVRTLWAGLHGICSLSGAGKLQTVSGQSDREMAEMLLDCFLAGLPTLSR